MTAFVTKVIDPVLGFIWPLKVGLPQNDGTVGRLRRGWRLRESQSTYQFNYSHVSTLAVCDSVPILDQVSFHWTAIVMEKAIVALENKAVVEMDTRAAEAHKARIVKFKHLKGIGISAIREMRQLVHEMLAFDGKLGAPAVHAETLKDYSKLFREIGLPPIAKEFQDDLAFANMRVAGPNPVMLRRMTAPDERLPITNAIFQIGAPGDSLEAAMAEARLYLVDFALLDGAETGSFPNGQKYISAPLALFVVDQQTKLLKPVAIQLNQKPGPNNPIFTKADGWNWMIAKTFVEVADGNVHEAMTHLGKTHLAMEPFVVSSLRLLAPNHPLSRLLRPHFQGTLSINKQSWRHLIADHGGVEKLCAASIGAARGLAVKGVQTIEVMSSLLPKTFAARGVDDASALPNYPYRDDALLYWNAVHKWVSSYVHLHYHSDSDVLEDVEVQAWSRELASKDGGRISGMPNGGAMHCLSELVDVLTFVIYTCSVQHAAVNFPQYDYMAYVPNMPLASYRPVPTSTAPATEADYLAMLPTLDMAELQMDLGYMLGGVHYTKLGEYDSDQFTDDGRVGPIAQQFQSNIAAAGSTITERNRQRQRPYTTLDPAGIPQSINI